MKIPTISFIIRKGKIFAKDLINDLENPYEQETAALKLAGILTGAIAIIIFLVLLLSAIGGLIS